MSVSRASSGHGDPPGNGRNPAGDVPVAPGGNGNTRRLSICFINPKFEPSYWGFDYALPLYPGKKRCTMITGALPTLAGLTDARHEIRLLDENVEDICFESLRRFDIVGVTGMNVQKVRMKEILLRLRELGIFAVVGGAYASVDREFFDGLCNVLFSGEADETWPRFVEDFAACRPFESFYEQESFTDMTTVPKPRYDLLEVDRYASGSLQFSRGCPFQCEFCDIIVTFGRRPRTKKPSQVIEELEDMKRAGFFSCFIVDDNFIGDKRKAKELLRVLAEWQEEHGYPLRLSTEASLNLADDREILDLMYRANFRHVFIGIETPRAASLSEVKKQQNVLGDSMEKKLARIQNAGIDVHAGFIVGFDSDDSEIFEDQFRFIQETGVLLALVTILGAIPKTALHERLKSEGRLVDDPNINFVPKQMSRDELEKGYWDLLERLYSPEAFLERYFRTYRDPEYLQRRSEISRKAAEGKTIPTFAYGVFLMMSLGFTLLKDRSLRRVGLVYLKYFFRLNLKYRRDVIGFAQFMNRCVTHWHFYKFTREARAGRLRVYNSG
jgi:radical SAM superfamily enzyme YgiQ (UPF0313 family)